MNDMWEAKFESGRFGDGKQARQAQAETGCHHLSFTLPLSFDDFFETNGNM